MIIKSALITGATSLLTVIVLLYFIVRLHGNESLGFDAFLGIALLLLPLTAFGIVTILCITCYANQSTLTARQHQNWESSFRLLYTRAPTDGINVNIEEAVLTRPQHTGHHQHNSSAHENWPQNNLRLSDRNDGHSNGNGDPPSYNQLLTEDRAVVGDDEQPPNYVEAIRHID